MNKVIWSVAELLLITVAVVLAVLAQDVVSVVLVILMVALVGGALLFGLLPLNRYREAFRTAQDKIRSILAENAASPWELAQREEVFFGHKELDTLFREYVGNVLQQQRYGIVMDDIGEVIHEDYIFIHSWQGVLQQIPGTLTGLGILGTFIGLIAGVRGVRFDDMATAVYSIQTLLVGIGTAFYTSIAGVILSILFNILDRMLWNVTIRELGMFTESFYRYIIPSEAEQLRIRQKKEHAELIDHFARLPSKDDFSSLGSGTRAKQQSSEAALLMQVQEGLKNNEFTFFLQPIFDLNTRKVLGAEALIRWQHPKMGIVSPSLFMDTIEKNGYITRLDHVIGELVCKTLRRWIDAGMTVVPITINISKTDILAMDVAKFFSDLIQKYRIPPMYIEIDIAQNAYYEASTATVETERNLRQIGLRVAIDHFDGDFVSLQAVNDLQPDMLKVDMRKMKERSNVVAVFQQAMSLRLNYAAVGIENMEMLATLRKSGCQRGQGYYLAKPIPIHTFEAELNRK